MTVFSNDNPVAKRIIIEGPDSVGKDTFIAGLQDFIDGVDRFGGRNLTMVGTTVYKDRINGEILTSVTDMPAECFLDYAKRDEMYETVEGPLVSVPKYQSILTHKTIHPRDGSPESKAFLANLDDGTLTDQIKIAEEYLQVHYDLENLADNLDDVYSVVIMNRSLLSYYAMQLHSLGFEQYREKWTKLWNYSRQDEALYIRLTAPEAVVRERLQKRQGDDFRGELENIFMARFNSIEQGFILAQERKLCQHTITVDTSFGEEYTNTVYQGIADWVVRTEMFEALSRAAVTPVSR